MCMARGNKGTNRLTNHHSTTASNGPCLTITTSNDPEHNDQVDTGSNMTLCTGSGGKTSMLLARMHFVTLTNFCSSEGKRKSEAWCKD